MNPGPSVSGEWMSNERQPAGEAWADWRSHVIGPASFQESTAAYWYLSCFPSKQACWNQITDNAKWMLAYFMLYFSNAWMKMGQRGQADIEVKRNDAEEVSMWEHEWIKLISQEILPWHLKWYKSFISTDCSLCTQILPFMFYLSGSLNLCFHCLFQFNKPKLCKKLTFRVNICSFCTCL